MKQPKLCLSLTPSEYRLLLYALVRFRNKLLAEGKYTDAVDEVIIKYTKCC